MFRSSLVTIATTSFDEVVDFYRQFLDREPVSYRDRVYAEFTAGGLRLGIFYPHRSHLPEFEHSHLAKMSICWEVSDLEAALDRLRKMGYQPPGEIINASHGREIYAYDPDGNRMIIHESKY
jgi:predicted enzyme related to lactoylglutathione lyase